VSLLDLGSLAPLNTTMNVDRSRGAVNGVAFSFNGQMLLTAGDQITISDTHQEAIFRLASSAGSASTQFS
jgi:hypothetical protein